MTVESDSALSLARMRAGRPARACSVLAFDERQETLEQVGGGDEQIAQSAARRLARAGQLVEELRAAWASSIRTCASPSYLAAHGSRIIRTN